MDRNDVTCTLFTEYNLHLLIVCSGIVYRTFWQSGKISDVPAAGISLSKICETSQSGRFYDCLFTYVYFLLKTQKLTQTRLHDDSRNKIVIHACSFDL